MKHFTLLALFLLPFISIQAQKAESIKIYKNWELNVKTHQLKISELPKKLPKDCKRIALSYQENLNNSKEFFILGDKEFYTQRLNAFKVNKRRYSGQLVGYDLKGDLRYSIEFRNGKLDGNYIIYNTDGSKLTKVYSNGKKIVDPIITKEED